MLASDRTGWRSVYKSAVQDFEAGHVHTLEAKHDLQKSGPPSTSNFSVQSANGRVVHALDSFSHSKSHSWWWDPSRQLLSPWSWYATNHRWWTQSVEDHYIHKHHREMQTPTQRKLLPYLPSHISLVPSTDLLRYPGCSLRRSHTQETRRYIWQTEHRETPYQHRQKGCHLECRRQFKIM